MTRACIFSALLMFVLACTDPDKIPGDVIPVAKMERVMWDMIQADRFSSQFNKDTIKGRADSMSFQWYHKVFALHGITREEFTESFDYYLSRPDITKTMFDSLASEAERIRPKLYKENP